MDVDTDSDLTSLSWLLSSNVMQPQISAGESTSTSALASTSCNLPPPESKIALPSTSTISNITDASVVQMQPAATENKAKGGKISEAISDHFQFGKGHFYSEDSHSPKITEQ